MAIVHIIRPELTTEERAARMERIKKATEALILATEKEKHKKFNRRTNK